MSNVNDQSKKRLRIAMQKSGRLTDETERLFKSCGIKINENRDHLLAHAENMPIDILRVRDDDIPGLVMDHVVDWGIVGQNVLEETSMQRKVDGLATGYKVVTELNYGDCRLAIATPQEEEWTGVECLQGKKIATTYPFLLRRALSAKGVDFKSVLLTGSVEVAPRAGLADAICDLVCTGATLQANGLKEVETIFESKAVIICRDQELFPEKRAGLADAICDLVCTGATLQANGLKEVETIFESKAVIICRDQELFPEKKAIADKILTRLKGVMTAKESKYIMMNAPRDKLKEITRLLQTRS